MIRFKVLGCHSRENGNPEPKNQNSWIPVDKTRPRASAGMTNLKAANLNFKNLKGFEKSEGNCHFSPIIGLIWTAMT